MKIVPSTTGDATDMENDTTNDIDVTPNDDTGIGEAGDTSYDSDSDGGCFLKALVR